MLLAEGLFGNEEPEFFDFKLELEVGEVMLLALIGLDALGFLGDVGDVGGKAELEAEELSIEALGSFLDLVHLMIAIADGQS